MGKAVELLTQVLEDAKRYRAEVLSKPRIYEPGLSREKQDAIIDDFIALQDELIKELPALIRREQMHVVDDGAA
jgi:hypothetical protein